MRVTVRKLIAMLETQDPDRIVVVTNDAEGNSFAPLASIVAGAFRATRDGGEFGIDALDDNLEELGYTEDDIVDGEPAVCLWPA